MDFKTYSTKVKLGEIKPKHLLDEITYDITVDIMERINKELNYSIYVAPYFRIKKVIFNNPATIVYWSDGDKTVVKCGKDDTYSEETGLALCFMKKALGNKGNYNNTFKKYIKEENNGKDNSNKSKQ